MKIKFIDFQRVNHSRDGLDLVFFFTAEDEPGIRKIHTVAKLGAQVSWFMTDEEVFQYSMQMFPLVIDLLESWWSRFKKLPPDDVEYFEGRELGYVRKAKLNWREYEIDLV